MTNKRSVSLFASIPILPCALLFIAHLLILLPLYLMSNALPWFLSSENPIGNSKYFPVALALITQSFLFLLICQILIKLCGKTGRVLSVLVLFLQFTVLFSSSVFFLDFGSFFGPEIIQDLLLTPGIIIGYINEGMNLTRFAVAFVLLAATGVLVIYCVRLTESKYTSGHSIAASAFFPVGFAILLVSGHQAEIPLKAYGTYMHMSIPSLKFWEAILDYSSNNSISEVSRYLPEPRQEGQDIRTGFERPENVLLLIMDTLRADHLPFYGYQRNTMPLTYKKENDYIVYRHFYSHAPWTQSAFSSLFASNYLASVNDPELVRRMAGQFWSDLGNAGVSTAFIGASDLKWGTVETLLELKRASFTAFPKDATPEQIREFSLPNSADGSLNDLYTLSQLKTFLETTSGPRFAVLYLLACHFPYKELPGLSPYQPSVSFNPDQSSDKRLLYTNSYDNSITGFDKFMDVLLGDMEKRGMLDNSLLIITGDHGESLGERGIYYHGFSLYEEQVQVPLLIRAGKNLPELNRLLEKSASNIHGHVDLVPTILEILKLPPVKGHQGLSLLSSKTKPYEVLPYKYLARLVAFVTKADKYIFDLDSRNASHFNLLTDKAEKNNLWDAPAGNLSEFLAVLERRGIIQNNNAGADY